MYGIEHSQGSEAHRINESDNGARKKKRTLDDDGTVVSSYNNFGGTISPIRILERIYPLSKTGYKFLDVCVTLECPSRVNIILGDMGDHGKEISMSPDTWRQLLEQRRVLSKYLQSINGELSFSVAHRKYNCVSEELTT
ncbi:hypothetical protein P5V15_001230 [Pogonomyrmex californicus]